MAIARYTLTLVPKHWEQQNKHAPTARKRSHGSSAAPGRRDCQCRTKRAPIAALQQHSHVITNDFPLATQQDLHLRGIQIDELGKFIVVNGAVIV